VLTPQHRPQIVHVVRAIGLTTWYRPLAAPLRERGLPRATRRARFMRRCGYRPLTSVDRARRWLVPVVDPQHVAVVEPADDGAAVAAGYWPCIAAPTVRCIVLCRHGMSTFSHGA
jgi:hypothetical protein